ncbi:MAG: hypothetical protein AAFN10_18920 [Bacteroidota bacterium]
MKRTYLVGLILSLTLLLSGFSLQAQENAEAQPAETQMFALWELHTSPSKMGQMVEAWKKMLAKMKEHDVPAQYGILTVDDGRFVITMPIENMADLDTDPLEGMAKTIGPEGMKELFMPMFELADKVDSYTLVMPKGQSFFTDADPRADAPYRRWDYFSFEPRAMMKISELAQKVNALYTKYDAPLGYIVYRDGMGIAGPLVVVENWGASEAELYENKLADMSDEFKKELQALRAEIGEHLVASQTFIGYYHADLSYEGPADVAKKE